MSELSADKLAKVYLKMRDKRQELARQFEEQDNDLKEQMEQIENRMLELCKDLGADSIKTAHGTIIRSVKTRYWTSDWESMHDFIGQHGAYDLLERRVHQTNMKQWLQENPDLLPMGLNSESRYSTTVRRSK
jgi:hypothetical protein